MISIRPIWTGPKDVKTARCFCNGGLTFLESNRKTHGDRKHHIVRTGKPLTTFTASDTVESEKFGITPVSGQQNSHKIPGQLATQNVQEHPQCLEAPFFF